MFILFDLIFLIFAFFYLPFFLFRLQNARSKKRLLLDRCGFLSEAFKRTNSRYRLWLHAVSVGEVMASKVLVEKILKENPEIEICFSTVTPTGNRLAHQLFGEKVLLFYFPFDVSLVVNHVLNVIQPDLIALMETEIWPNLIRLAKKKGSKICILNGRFSPRSFGRYYKFRGMIRKVLSNLDFVCVQNENYKRRFIRLGAPREKVYVTGTMKYDLVRSSLPQERNKEVWCKGVGFSSNSVLWVAASTHPGEEEICLNVFLKLIPTNPELKLVLAPRHPERGKEIARLCERKDLSFSLAEKMPGIKETTSSQVHILNNIGHLMELYEWGDLVFIGGSLVERGGHNPLEPALFKKPILTGEHVFNFKDVFQSLYKKEGILFVENEQALEEALSGLLNDEKQRVRLGGNAFLTLESMRGASDKNYFYLMREIQKVR